MFEGSQQAATLASRFRAENAALAAFVAELSEREWAMDCPSEGRSIGVVVGHITEGHLVIGAIIRAMVAGRPLPVQARRTEEQGASFNARQARHLATRTREDGLRMLRSNTTRIGRFIERLDDADLQRTAPGADGVTVADAIERALLGHPRSHGDAVTSAVLRARAVGPAADSAG